MSSSFGMIFAAEDLSIHPVNPHIDMENPELQHLVENLDYGIIYVCGNPKQTHNLRWFATMIDWNKYIQ